MHLTRRGKGRQTGSDKVIAVASRAGRFVFLLTTCLIPGGLLISTTSQLAAQTQQALAEDSHRARELMAAGKFKEAVPIYQKLVRTLPGNPGLILNLGMALHLAGDDEQAIPQLQKALNLDPGNIPASLFLGAAHMGLGRPEQAVPLLEKVVQSEPDNANARGLLAEAYYSLERYSEAAGEFRRLTQLTAEDPKAWDGLGRSEEALARRVFEKLQKAAPDSGYWLALAADSRAKDQQFSSSFYLYRQALDRMPGLRGVHAAVAEIYRKTGHADWAAVEEERENQLGLPDCSREKLECDFRAGGYLTLIAAAREFDTPESDYWNVKAHNRLALEAFNRLTQLPPSAELYALMARINSEHKDYREAVSHWQEALKLSPGDAHIKKELALALSLSGEYQAAELLLRALIREEPESPELEYLLGNALLSQQKPDDAIPLLEKAVTRQPEMLTAQDALARAYLQVGQAAKAIPHLKAALPVDQNGSLHYQLARAYQMSGQPELARTTLAEYQRITKSATVQRQSLQEEIRITPP